MRGGVRQVVERADAADPEERDGRHLAAVEPAVERLVATEQAEREVARHRTHHQDQGERDDDTAPVEVLEQAAGHRHAQHEQHEQRHQPFEPLDHGVHGALVGVAALGGAQAHRAGEDGEEAVAADQLRRAVRRHQCGERQEGLALLGESQVVPLGVEGLAAEEPPDREADGDAERDLAQDVPPQPRTRVERGEAAREQQEREVDEREGQAVVETGLGGEREPDVVVLLVALLVVRVVDVVGQRLTDLHVRGEDGIGRGQHGTEQERDRGREPRHPPAEQRGAGDGERHRHQQQPPDRRPRGDRAPRPEVEGAVDREPDAHQRDQDGELGDVGDQLTVVLRLQAHHVRQRQQPEEHPDTDQHHRGRERDASRHLRQHDGQEQGQAEEEVDRAAGHRSRRSGRRIRSGTLPILPRPGVGR